MLDSISQDPFPHPRDSKSVLEILNRILGIDINLDILECMVTQIDEIIESIYKKFPQEIRERIEQRKSVVQAKSETITEEDEKWIKEHIDEFFKGGGGGNERAV